MLYIVPTPVGNLEDITLRALRLLKEVDVIWAEDTRTSKKLLSHYGITTPLRAYHQHNEHHITVQLVAQLQSGQTAALITDAGTPAISDPGFLLVRACVQGNVRVECLPGATAFVPALVASGLPCDRFHFEGFLPHKKGRQTRLDYLATLPHTVVLYESPHRILKCLEQLKLAFGATRPAAVCRELSKVYEEIVRGSLAELVERFAQKAPKGEMVIVVGGVERTKFGAVEEDIEMDEETALEMPPIVEKEEPTL